MVREDERWTLGGSLALIGNSSDVTLAYAHEGRVSTDARNAYAGRELTMILRLRR